MTGLERFLLIEHLTPTAMTEVVRRKGEFGLA
jgi:hypothetical protein